MQLYRTDSVGGVSRTSTTSDMSTRQSDTTGVITARWLQVLRLRQLLSSAWRLLRSTKHRASTTGAEQLQWTIFVFSGDWEEKDSLWTPRLSSEQRLWEDNLPLHWYCCFHILWYLFTVLFCESVCIFSFSLFSVWWRAVNKIAIRQFLNI